MLAGAMLALAFWSKYAAFALAISLGLFLLIDPVARQALRTPGPWLMAAAFLVVIAPNAWWLVDSGFLPLQYVGDRAKIPERAFQYVTYPLTWMASQVFFIHPTLILLGITLFPRMQSAQPVTPQLSFARRYVTTLAFMPFVVVTVAAIVTGRSPIAMWGYPLWSFLPLAALAVVRPGHRSAADVRFCRRRDLPVLAGTRDLDRNLHRRPAFALTSEGDRLSRPGGCRTDDPSMA